MPSIGRTMKEMGLKINEQGNEDTQIEALLITLEQTLQPEGVYARSWLDGLVYSQYLYEQGQIPGKVVDLWKRWTEKHLGCFDAYFYIRPEFPLVADGTRSVDEKFYNRSKELMEQYVQEYSKKLKIHFYRVSGTVEKRTKQVQDVLKKQNLI